MTFQCIEGRCCLVTEGGSYELSRSAIDELLAVFDREGAVKLWLDLDIAAQQAGYPGSVSSLRWFRPEPATVGRGAHSPRSPQSQHFDGKDAQ